MLGFFMPAAQIVGAGHARVQKRIEPFTLMAKKILNTFRYRGAHAKENPLPVDWRLFG